MICATKGERRRLQGLQARMGCAMAVMLALVLLPGAWVKAAFGDSVQVDAATTARTSCSTGELIIVYEDELCELDADVVAEQEEILAADGSTGAIAVATVADGASVEEALDALAGDPNVVSVQPNYIYQLLESDGVEDGGGVSDESSLASYLELAGFTAAWDALAGCELASATVAVVDTGCNLLHEELVDALDADLAYDAVSGTALGSAGVANNGDSNGHGTMVCGVVAAAGGGVVDVLPIRIFDDDGTATTADILTAYAYLDGLIESGRLTDLCAINLSIGYYPDDSTTESDAALEAAIETMLEEHGVLTVCAGGNSSSSDALYPADFGACLSVASVDGAGAISAFSDLNEFKDLFAYGENVLSTSADGGFSTLTGTSMAAPQAAAAVALIRAACPGLSAAQVVAILQETATEVAGADDGTPGILNVAAAVQAALATAAEETESESATGQDDASDTGSEAEAGDETDSDGSQAGSDTGADAGADTAVSASSESASESDGSAEVTLLDDGQATLAETGDAAALEAAACATAGLLLLTAAIARKAQRGNRNL